MGIRRLSIIDPESGHQPAANEDKTVWIVLNGEIYNYRELREELIRKGHRFETHSDTEILPHLYEEEGEDMVHRLRGMFAIALWDSARKLLLLIRDPLGIKPLYYAEQDGALTFASEIPALRAALPSTSIRPQAIAQYLTLLYIPAPETVFTGIRQLMPGEILRFQEGKKTLHRYFNVRTLAASLSTNESPVTEDRFRDVLQETVRAHMVSDVPIGLFLSGGLDSGSMLAMMRKVTGGPIRTFSIGYEAEADAGFNETGASRMLAERFGADHTEQLVRPNAVDLLTKITRAMGEPFADSSVIPTYLVSEMASGHVKVALSGIGGDELFGGYPRYLGMRASRLYERLPRGVRRILALAVPPLFKEHGGHNDRTGRLSRFFKTGYLSLAQQYIRWITFLPPEWADEALSHDLVAAGEPTIMTPETYGNIFTGWPSPSPCDAAMGLDIQTYLPDDLLRMGDRLSMAHSLELRVPFCDHELLKLALQVPAPQRLRRWQLKGFMREALRQVLPPEILSGPKRGFMVPFSRWLREDLREMLGDLLSETSVRHRGYVKPSYAQWLISEHMSGRRNFPDQLFALLVLELWLRQLE